MHVRVYAGDGTSSACVTAIACALRCTDARLRIRPATWQMLAGDAWLFDTDLLVIPGGRDVPYVRLLGRASVQIRAFVARGGRYLGSCAGAYFAASCIDFAAGEPCAVAGLRPLRLWRGRAVGPIGPRPFAYDEPAQAVAAPLLTSGGSAFRAYTHGGCAFVGRALNQSKIVARYAEGGMCAALLHNHGRGRVLLWGVHPELGAAAAHRLGARAEVVRALSCSVSARQQIWAQSVRALLAP